VKGIRVVSQKAFPLLDVIVAKYGAPADYLRVGDMVRVKST
jgi:hypothetical protein